VASSSSSSDGRLYSALASADRVVPFASLKGAPQLPLQAQALT
jgi:hypothetical protein